MAKTSAAEAPKAVETNDTQTPSPESVQTPEAAPAPAPAVEIAKPVAPAPAPAPAPAAETPKAAKVPKWRVTLDDASEVIEAVNESDAWAKFCDGRKKWPSPRTPGRKIERVEE